MSRHLLLCLALAAMPALAQPHHGDHADPATAPHEAEAQDPAAVVDAFSGAIAAGDLDAAAALLADDVLVLESGGAERSKAEYLASHAAADAEFLKNAHVQRGERTVRTSGELAWVGTESEIHTASDGRMVTLLSTETMVLQRMAAGWRIVHIHWSSRKKE
jgi:uncharacterized protein (TIGR02246 family)